MYGRINQVYQIDMDFLHNLNYKAERAFLGTDISTHLFAIVNGGRQWLDTQGNTKCVPVLDVVDVSAIHAVELQYHCIFEGISSLLPLFIFLIPVEEIAHTVEFFGYSSISFIVKFGVARKEGSNRIRRFPGFSPRLRLL
jgi:hypothetical protein